MTESIRSALAGLGNIAWKLDQKRPAEFPALTHAKAIALENQTRLVAGYSPSQQECLDFESVYELPTFTDFAQLLEYTKPDLVSICSATEIHTSQVIQLIQAKTPMIWLEKPPCSNLDELEQMQQALTASSTTLLVNYQRRFQQSYLQLKKAFAEQSLGPCKSIQITYSRGLETNGSHLLDILFFITGDQSIKLEWVEQQPSQTSPSFQLSLPDGTAVAVTGMELDYHCIDIQLTFAKGRLSVDHGGMDMRQETRQEHEYFPGFYRLIDQPVALDTGKDLLSGMQNALTELLNAHQQGRQPSSNLQTSGKTMALMQKIRQHQGFQAQ